MSDSQKEAKVKLKQVRQRSRGYSVTEWWLADERLKWYKQQTEGDNPWIRAIVYQEEICPETGNHHWQMYLQMFEQVDCHVVSQRLCSQSGLCTFFSQMARKSGALVRYCQKYRSRHAGPWFIPEANNPLQSSISRRREQEEIVRVMRDGHLTPRQIENEFGAYCLDERSYQGVVAAWQRQIPRRMHQPYVWYLTGASRTGKNMIIELILLFAGIEYCQVNGRHAFWGTYDPDPNKVCIINEFYGDMNESDYKLMLDSGTYNVPVKNVSVCRFSSPWVIILSEWPWQDWYGDKDSIYGRGDIFLSTQCYERETEQGKERYWGSDWREPNKQPYFAPVRTGVCKRRRRRP